MQVNRIQQNQVNKTPSFNGTLGSFAKYVIRDIARQEAVFHVENLNKGVVASKADLIGIKQYWESIIKKLENKAAKMHPDTVLSFNSERCWEHNKFNIVFANVRLGAAVNFGEFLSPLVSSDIKCIKDSLNNILEEIDEKSIDKGILNNAIEEFKENLPEGSLKYKANHIKRIEAYQSELSNVSEEEVLKNKETLTEALEAEKQRRAFYNKAKRASNLNKKLIEEIFSKKSEF